MAIIRKNEIKGMDMKQLLTKKQELQKEMIKINAQLSTKTTPENPGRVREVKKTIARINTVMTQIRTAPQEQKKVVQEKKKPEPKKAKEVKKTKS